MNILKKLCAKFEEYFFTIRPWIWISWRLKRSTCLIFSTYCELKYFSCGDKKKDVFDLKAKCCRKKVFKQQQKNILGNYFIGPKNINLTLHFHRLESFIAQFIFDVGKIWVKPDGGGYLLQFSLSGQLIFYKESLDGNVDEYTKNCILS